MGDRPLNQLKNLFVFCHGLEYRKLADARILAKATGAKGFKIGFVHKKVGF